MRLMNDEFNGWKSDFCGIFRTISVTVELFQSGKVSFLEFLEKMFERSICLAIFYTFRGYPDIDKGSKRLVSSRKCYRTKPELDRKKNWSKIRKFNKKPIRNQNEIQFAQNPNFMEIPNRKLI